jgi:hypothetical protein
MSYKYRKISGTSPADIAEVNKAIEWLVGKTNHDIATITDHGVLTGLADDDHPQYFTTARGDARYAPVAKGVTNGDAHDHYGGDGGQIAYSSLSGLPAFGTAAYTDATAYATAAQGAKADSAILTTGGTIDGGDLIITGGHLLRIEGTAPGIYMTDTEAGHEDFLLSVQSDVVGLRTGTADNNYSLYIIKGGNNGTAATIGFLGAAPVARPGAYAQTYSTAARTVANATATNAPAGGTGTAAGGWSTAANRDAAIASINNCIADVAALKQVVNSVIDDLQLFGLLA